MPHKSEDLAALVANVKRGGAEKYHAKNESEGKLFARERLSLLLDASSFVEDGLLANTLAGDLQQKLEYPDMAPAHDGYFLAEAGRAVICTQACVPEMLKAGGGAIVNIASISGLRASTLRVAYGTSKAALLHLTKQLGDCHELGTDTQPQGHVPNRLKRVRKFSAWRMASPVRASRSSATNRERTLAKRGGIGIPVADRGKRRLAHAVLQPA